MGWQSLMTYITFVKQKNVVVVGSSENLSLGEGRYIISISFYNHFF